MLHQSRSGKRSLDIFGMTDVLVAPTSACHISPQNTTCTAERPPTSGPEIIPSKVFLLPRKWWDRWTCLIPLLTVRQHPNQTTASSINYTQHAVWIHYPTATNSHLHNVSHEQTWQDCPKSGGPRKVKVKRMMAIACLTSCLLKISDHFLLVVL